MSDVLPDVAMKEILGRIDRQREETLKYVAEQHKLIAEQSKLNAEQSKLSAEARKLDRDRALAPWQIALGGIAAGATLFAAGGAFVKILLG